MAPPSSSPGRAGALGTVRAGLPEWVEWGKGQRSRRRAGSADDAAASHQPLGELGDPCAPVPGPRPLAVSTSFPHTPPGPPGPQAFPALLPSAHTPWNLGPPAACRPCCLRGESSSGSPFTHAPSLAGPPHPLQPSSSSFLTPPSGED